MSLLETEPLLVLNTTVITVSFLTAVGVVTVNLFLLKDIAPYVGSDHVAVELSKIPPVTVLVDTICGRLVVASIYDTSIHALLELMPVMSVLKITCRVKVSVAASATYILVVMMDATFITVANFGYSFQDQGSLVDVGEKAEIVG